MAISEAVKRINERIGEACLRAGRRPSEVRLMAVSKFHTLPEIEEAWQAGIRLFGENRVQEAAAKFADFRARHPGAELHLIGSLQRNKAKTAAAFFDLIQSVDREALIEELGTAAARRSEPLQVLLELHTGEDSKAGFPDTDSLCRAAERLLSCPALIPAGLMTMAPFTGDEGRIRASFRALRAAAERLSARFPEACWSCLSMGMSNDFEIAIEEGSTLVRIGTALFGERHT
ncbi:MAG: YggS family pyridoxal phosphate-dependent enzyme [Treponema sp.]|nr:YggS family pyridoxal phosphate-dependent enzyme [Treponema sp.]